MSKPHSELRADVARERERRHWTIEQQRNIYGDDWPAGIARTRKEADDAVDSLFEQHNALRSSLQALVDWADGKAGDDFGDTEWTRAREALKDA